MKLLKKILIISGIIFASLILVIFLFLYINSRGSTPVFKDKKGHIIENSVAEMKYVKIGGIEQFILIRGKSRENPILLILHGGPGNPELPMYRKFNSELEDYFTVVYWDQRGAGKSAPDNIPANSFTLDQFVEDTHELTGYLKAQFKKDKIFLLGHSWGSILGVSTVNKYPNDYYAYVGTGQIGNQPKSESLAYQFILKKANQANDTTALNKLNNIGEFSNANLNKTGILKWIYAERRYVSEFGGSTYNPQAAMDVFILPLLYCSEYSLGNKYAYIKSNGESTFLKSPFRKMIGNVLNTDLSTAVPELKVPVYFLEGRNDYLANYSVAKEYFDSLKAPEKKFITFEKSAHFPSAEESVKFNDVMIKQVLPESVK